MNQHLQEKDAIAFLGLMALGSKNFDEQFRHADGQFSHHRGLNIFAAITDNTDGEVIGQQQNSIHAFINPMMHAEQLTLKESIERLAVKRPIDPVASSVEEYYRNKLFNQPGADGDFRVGSTLYTTLEPCPFCTSALLVTRMKRIVYIIPDPAFGGSFAWLKPRFYNSYDMSYAQLNFGEGVQSGLIAYAAQAYAGLLGYISKKPGNATLYLDGQKAFLDELRNHFLTLDATALDQSSPAFAANLTTLKDFQLRTA